MRIDGIYFDSSETNGSNRHLNKRIFDSIDAASGVIFQSEFSVALLKDITENRSPSTVILNGAFKTSEGYDERKSDRMLC